LEQAKHKVAIIQSNYIPWKGYFDMIGSVDEFILFDDAQFTRRDWRNRNKIKTPQGIKWLTIPVAVKGKYYQKIKETEISDTDWGRQHFETIRTNYARAPFFQYYRSLFEPLYLSTTERMLSQVNRHFIEAICAELGITTQLTWSDDYEVVDGKNERLITLCKQAGADHYLSGPTAQSYLDETAFAAEGITVSYMDYAGYAEYPQLYPPFDHAVSIIDLLFNVGPKARDYMRSAQVIPGSQP
jgi:hypothetical protein